MSNVKFGPHRKPGTPAGAEPAIANPTGGITVDAEARTAINAILVVLRKHGLINP